MTTKQPALPMLPWWPSDYFSATRAFTLAERGAYTDLLFYSWLNGPLPHEPERLARLVGVTPQEFAEVWPTIKSKFEVTAAGLINRRLERERQKTIELRTKNSEKASEAARARWLKDAANARSNAPSIGSLEKPDASSNAPGNARSNAPSIGASRPGPQEPDLMLGAMLGRCPPSPSSSSSPSPSSSPSSSPAPSLGGGEEGSGEKLGNLSLAALSPEERWKSQRAMIAEGLVKWPWPKYTDKEIAAIMPLGSGITKEMVKAYRGSLPKRAAPETPEATRPESNSGEELLH